MRRELRPIEAVTEAYSINTKRKTTPSKGIIITLLLGIGRAVLWSNIFHRQINEKRTIQRYYKEAGQKPPKKEDLFPRKTILPL